VFKSIKELFRLLTPKQRRRFYKLQFLVVFMAFAEIVGVASIGPFMALVGDINLLSGDNILAQIYHMTGYQNPNDFLFLTGISVLITLTLATIFSTYTTWRLSLFSATVGTEISDALYNHYLHQNWLFHASGSSAQLTKQVSTESQRISNSVIQPLMQINARIVLILFISVAIFLFNPLVALTGISIFVGGYLIIYKLVSKRLHNNGKTISTVASERFRLMNEGFGGIKDLILLGRTDDFVNRFRKSGKQQSYAQGTNATIGLVPRYFMELLAFSALIILILVLIKNNNGDLSIVLPILGIYALAAFKVLPAMQQAYVNFSFLKGNIVAFENVREDLLNARNATCDLQDANTEKLELKKSIKLENIDFTYPNKATPALKHLNLEILVNQTIGIVGPSGSGKSTAIDLLLGLITPDSGQLKIDGTIISNTNLRAWQNAIGFVPQSIFLSEGTIAENVAFGIPVQQINIDQVNKALSLAHLNELIEGMPEGINTKVGERGIQLSGGQRQRIGIARALYHEASVLVFDEATSALDGITEKMVMDAIHDFSGQKTIIMIAHRLKTVQKCDTIFMIKNGQVVGQGAYETLIETNPEFERMASHA